MALEVHFAVTICEENEVLVILCILMTLWSAELRLSRPVRCNAEAKQPAQKKILLVGSSRITPQFRVIPYSSRQSAIYDRVMLG